MTTTTLKMNALAIELKIESDDIMFGHDDTNFEAEGAEYMVLTEEERDEKTEEYITQTLWAFNSSFLSSATGFDEMIFQALAEKYEDANDSILSLIKASCGLEKFIEEAVSVDGHGHFLSSYDGDELELKNDFYAYRTN